MKKLFILFTLFSFSCINAIELELDMAIGTQFSGSSGTLVYTKDFWKGSEADINHDSNLNFYSWMEIRTDQKYWPKMRFEVSRLVTEGSSDIRMKINQPQIEAIVTQITEKFNITEDITQFDTGSKLRQNTYEVYLYYEYFEKTGFPTIGLGGGVKIFDFAYNALVIDTDFFTLEGLEFTDSGKGTAPMAFLKSRYDVDTDDGTTIALQAEGRGYFFGDSTLYDYLLKAEFLMPYNKETDIGFEFGYKASYYDIAGDDIVKVGGDMNNGGVYFGLVGHFR